MSPEVSPEHEPQTEQPSPEDQPMINGLREETANNASHESENPTPESVQPEEVALGGIARAIKSFSRGLLLRGEGVKHAAGIKYATHQAEGQGRKVAKEAYRRAKFGTGETDIRYSPGLLDKTFSKLVPDKKFFDEYSDNKYSSGLLESASVGDGLIDSKIITIQSKIQKLERMYPDSKNPTPEVKAKVDTLKAQLSELHTKRETLNSDPEEDKKDLRGDPVLLEIRKNIHELEKFDQSPVIQYQIKLLKQEQNRLLSEFTVDDIPGAKHPAVPQAQGRIVPALRHAEKRQHVARDAAKSYREAATKHYIKREEVQEKLAELKKGRKSTKAKRQEQRMGPEPHEEMSPEDLAAYGYELFRKRARRFNKS